MLRGRVLSALYFISVRLDGSEALAPDVAVSLDELGEKSSWWEVS